MGQIIRISKEGIDATTGTAPDNLVFSSDYNTLKYHLSGTINVDKPGSGTAEGTVAHSLGYIPFFVAYVNKYATPGGVDYNMCPGHFSDVGIYDYAQAYADSTNIYFRMIASGEGTATFTFRYFVFRNNLGL